MPELVQQLTDACGPGMPGPYGEFKDIWAAVGYRNPSGAAAPPPFDKGGRGSGVSIHLSAARTVEKCCPNNRNPPSDSVY